MKKVLNFVKGREKKHKLKLLAIDFGFITLIAFITMFMLSVIMSWSSSDQIRVEQYIQAQITKLNKAASEYKDVKTQRDKLLDMASDLANIRASQYYILLGIEKISRAITDELYITNINYVVSTDNVIVSGEVQDLKLLSVFMKNLEIEFRVKKVELKNLGSEKGGKRSFTLEYKFGEDNAFKGDSVK
jgi:type IV pilus assembly protein PilN